MRVFLANCSCVGQVNAMETQAFPRNPHGDDKGLTKLELISAILMTGMIANEDIVANWENLPDEAIQLARRLLVRTAGGQ